MKYIINLGHEGATDSCLMINDKQFAIDTIVIF